jgi:hypothetical protein
MATAETVRSLRESICTQLRTLRELGPRVKPVLDEVEQALNALSRRLPRELSGEDARTWQDLPAEDQQAFCDELKTLGKRLDALDREGRSCTKSETALLLGYAALLPIVLLILIFLCMHQGAISASDVIPATSQTTNNPADGGGKEESDSETGGSTGQNSGESDPVKQGLNDTQDTKTNLWAFSLIVCVGAIGGCLRVVGSAVYFLGQRKLYRNWLAFYYFAPLEGALLAFLVSLLVLGGIVDPSNIFGAKAQPKSMMFFYGMAAFTGMFAKNVLRKLKELADATFGVAGTTDAA